jgi:hypothetical protein
MPRKAAPKPDDPKQSKRFIDMAREVEAHGSKADLGRALGKIAKTKPKDDKPSRG